MKKIFITVISLLLPLIANAAVEINGIWYNLSANDYTAEVVASQGTQYSGDISISYSVYYGNQSYIVKSIGNSAFEGCVDITSVSIPSSVTSIGNGAFWQCSSLESVIIPNGVTTIGEGAFHNCFNLVSVFIPSSVTSIGSSAFSNCNNLSQVISRIQNPFSINNNVFTTYSTTTLVIPKDTKSAYLAKTGWKNFIKINDDPTKRTIHVATAGTLSYYISDEEKYQIEELTLSGVLNGTDSRLIRDMAGTSFYYTYGRGGKDEFVNYVSTNGNLKSLNIADVDILGGGGDYFAVQLPGQSEEECCDYYSTTTDCISELMFYLTKLESIIIPNSVMSIKPDAFTRCATLKSIKVKNNSFFDSRNDCNAIIGTSANTLVAGCKTTTIPNSVTRIGNNAFSNCTSLTSITIPNNVTSIGNNAFHGCTGLTSIEIPNSVTSIGNNAFHGCTGLTSIEIPNSVTSIGSNTFANCSGLTTIVSEIENPFAIDDYVFYSWDKDIYAKATLIVPAGKKSAYQTTAGWSKFQKIVEVGGVGYEFESDGIRYYIGENNTVFVVPRDPIYTGDVVIPGSVEYDGKTYTVTTIGGAFWGCSSLTSITIPPSITRIKEDSFSGCTGLTSVHISDLEAWLKVRLDGGSYDDLDYSGSPLYFAHHLYLNGEEVKTIEIPNTWTSIPDFSFDRWSGLTSVTIPNSVTSIGFLAFRGCSGLTSVNIPSSVTSMGWGAFLLCNGLTTIVSEIENPFTIDESVFDNLYATTTLIVPFGKKSAYQNTAGWNKFQNIRELTLGDVNLDAEVNKTDLNALVAYIMDETPEGFDKDLADLNGDDDVNAADVVTLVNLLNKSGLSTEYQPYFDNDNGNLVVTSINCTLNNERNKAIQLTKCELYCNNSMVSYKSYSDGSTVAAGGNKTCSFAGLSIPANNSCFSVVWFYTYNGESYVYRCDLTE